MYIGNPDILRCLVPSSAIYVCYLLRCSVELCMIALGVCFDRDFVFVLVFCFPVDFWNFSSAWSVLGYLSLLLSNDR